MRTLRLCLSSDGWVVVGAGLGIDADGEGARRLLVGLALSCYPGCSAPPYEVPQGLAAACPSRLSFKRHSPSVRCFLRSVASRWVMCRRCEEGRPKATPKLPCPPLRTQPGSSNRCVVDGNATSYHLPGCLSGCFLTTLQKVPPLANVFGCIRPHPGGGGETFLVDPRQILHAASVMMDSLETAMWV